MIIALSGGFDPIHRGHIAMIKEASRFGRVHIYLNSDAWLKRKKGFIFMDYEDRAHILWEIKGVELVIPASDDDGTVCETLRKFKPDYFGNGGDRGATNTPEVSLCDELGIKTVFNLGGDKVNSSSAIVEKAVENKLENLKEIVGQW